MTTPTTIVIADDHVLVREGLKMLLSAADPALHVVAETGDGAAVEALVRKLSPALLVLDLELPGKSGIDIAAAIKADASIDCKVLVLTGTLKAETVARALAAGADGYVLKGDDAAELIGAIRAVLAGQVYVSRQIAGIFGAGTGTGRSAPAQITPREREVLSLVARGFANNDIGTLLDISVLTVRTHRQRLMEKLGLRNAAEITACAVKLGLYDPS
ncbi:MAG: response regulator transcription factor [Caldimonas sp.]